MIIETTVLILIGLAAAVIVIRKTAGSAKCTDCSAGCEDCSCNIKRDNKYL